MLIIIHVGHSLATRLLLWVRVLMLLKRIDNLALVDLYSGGNLNKNRLKTLGNMPH